MREILSFPTRERGLKWSVIVLWNRLAVVPHAGTWIEIGQIIDCNHHFCTVVPHAGTWIEMPLFAILTYSLASFPTRERGLKSSGERLVR